jgi:ribosomal-protein-serine acetyltransferase
MIKIDEDIKILPVSLASAKVIFESIHSSSAHLREWLPFVDGTKSVDDTKNFIKSVLNSNCPKRDEIFEIWFENDFAGLIGFKEIDKVNSKLEIGYWLDKKMTGKGIMIRSVKRMIEYSFVELTMNRVMIKVASGNTKSIAIAKKLGFTFEGIEREGEYLNWKFHDLEVYSLLKKDWV